jgi:hypothetical protein
VGSLAAYYYRGMAERRFEVGDTALVSRAQNGQDHEEATVIDVYELLIAEDRIPMIVVDFDDGERLWIRAEEPDVLEPEEEEAADEREPAEGAEAAVEEPAAEEE